MSTTFNDHSAKASWSKGAGSRAAAMAVAVAGLGLAADFLRRIARLIEARRAERRLLELGEAGLKDIGLGQGSAGWAARHGRSD